MSHPSPPGDWPPRRAPVESSTEELPQYRPPAIPRQWTPPHEEETQRVPPRVEEAPQPHSYWDAPAAPVPPPAPAPAPRYEPPRFEDRPRYEEPPRFDDRPHPEDGADLPAGPPEPTGSIRRKHAYTGHITRKGAAATVIAILAVALFVAAVLWGLSWLRDKAEKDKYDDYGATSSQVTTAAHTQRRTPAADW